MSLFDAVKKAQTSAKKAAETMAKPKTAPAPDRPPPLPPAAAEACPLCANETIAFCVYHACQTPDELSALLLRQLKARKQGEPLEGYFAALLSGVTSVPKDALASIAKQDVAAMVERLEANVYGEKGSLDFRRFAGLALAIAVVLEAQEALENE